MEMEFVLEIIDGWAVMFYLEDSADVVEEFGEPQYREAGTEFCLHDFVGDTIPCADGSEFFKVVTNEYGELFAEGTDKRYPIR